MGKIQNIFAKGTLNKDSDARFLENNELIDAENFFVTTSEGDGGGVGKNALGNVRKMILELPEDVGRDYEFANPKTIGLGKNEVKNKVYNFIKSSDLDCIVEYDTVAGTYEFLAMSRSGLTLNFIEGERITNVDVIVNGETGDELLAWSGDSNPPRICNIERMRGSIIDHFTEDEISVMKPSPIYAPEINLTQTPDGFLTNFIEDKFIRFAYRYKYKDGYYSAPSSWSNIAFSPKKFELDYQTYENKGMINIANAVDVIFQTGPEEVIAVELLFKESDKNTIYVAQSFVKTEEEWDNHESVVFQFSKSKIFKILSEDQTTRSFDNVPLSAVAQTTIMGRLAYANYVEGRDIDTVIDLEAEVVSTSPFTGTTTTAIANAVTAATYSNVVDFTEGTQLGGSLPEDQMDYVTNEVGNNLPSSNVVNITIEITPESLYSASVYNIHVVEKDFIGTETVQTWSGLSGHQTKTWSPDISNSFKIVVTSDTGLIYDCKMNSKKKLALTTLSNYDYFSYHQLCLPKSGGYGSTKVGDTVINGKTTINFSGYEFKSGKQIRVDFELQSSLVGSVKPSISYFYNLSADYANLGDFITKSDFKTRLEGEFSDLFKGTEGYSFISYAGTIVTDSYVGFKLSYSGSVMTITNPFVKYNIEDEGHATVKPEFFITTSVECLSLSENSYASLHSNRDYEICQIYLDDKGRKTTALVSKNNTFHVLAENNDMVNKAKVTVNHDPPSWARYYKFGIKQVKRNYETIFGNIVYKDDLYRWVQLVGENKNKVKEGDLLTVKSDYTGPLDHLAKTKVLEIIVKEQDFVKGNKIGEGATEHDLIEEAGLYMKIKPVNFDVTIDEDSFKSYKGAGKRRYASRSFVTTSPIFGEIVEDVFVPTAIKAGTVINLFIRIQMGGSASFDHKYDLRKTASNDYASMKAWFDAEVADTNEWSEFLEHSDLMTYSNPIEYEFDSEGKTFSIKPWRDGTASRDVITDIVFDVNFCGGNLIFETEPFEDLSSPFFETPETYLITDGAHEFTEHVLEGAFNCFSFGNGLESYKVEDTLTGNSFSLNCNPTEVSKEGYKQIRRFADITYGGTRNSNSAVNRLNEFNLSTANFKDDLEKNYGAIYKIKGGSDNLQVFQENKDSQVLYGKDALYNADGTSNLSKISNVLGSQIAYAGDFGISSHPDSFDVYGLNTYHTDVRRGVVIKKSNNGLFEASTQGMRSFFKSLFLENTINSVNGKYDSYNDFYVLNVKYNNNQYQTWVYSDKDNGWLGRITFDPEDMICVNGKFLAFKNGEAYEHNRAVDENGNPNYNTFFGVEYDSFATMNFSQNPSERKQYKTFEIEGTIPVDITAQTDMNSGYVNKEDFDKVENVHYGYIRTNNDVIDASLLSCQGIGVCTSVALSGPKIIGFDFDLEEVVSIGDNILNEDLVLVGKIVGKTRNSVTVDAYTFTPSIGNYLVCSKPQSVENSHLLGYHCQATLKFSSNTKQEIYAINSEVAKSLY